MEEIKSALLEILQGIRPDVDFENSDNLMDGGILDSFDIISLISEINDEFDVVVSADKIIPENFNSLESLAELIETLMEED